MRLQPRRAQLRGKQMKLMPKLAQESIARLSEDRVRRSPDSKSRHRKKKAKSYPDAPPASAAGAADPTPFCLCGNRAEYGLMIECDSCGRWYHNGCVGVEEVRNELTYLIYRTRFRKPSTVRWRTARNRSRGSQQGRAGRGRSRNIRRPLHRSRWSCYFPRRLPRRRALVPPASRASSRRRSSRTATYI